MSEAASYPVVWQVRHCRGLKYVNVVVGLGLIALYVYVAGYSCRFMWRLAHAPDAQEYRENAIVLTTKVMLRGENPYDLEHQPLYINVYGLGYHWVVLPFTRVLGSGFLAHRGVSCLAVLASCLALAFALWRRGVYIPLALAGAALWLVSLSRSLSILARPDAVGMLAFLLALLIPLLANYRPWSLAISLLLGVFGFLTKPYFVFSIPCLAAYLFLFRGKLAGVIYGFAGALLLAAAIALMNARYPYYLTDTFFIHVNVAGRNVQHLIYFGSHYLRQNTAVFAAMAIAALALLVHWLRTPADPEAAPRREGRFSLTAIRRPLFDVPVDLMVFMLFCCTTAMVTLLGLHPGNGRLYYDQLISPFLFWTAIRLAQRTGFGRLCMMLALAGNLYFLLPLRPGLRTVRPRYQQREYVQLARLVADHKKVYASPPLIQLLYKQGRPIYNTGQTQYFWFGARHNLSNVSAEYAQRGRRFAADLQNAIRHQEFDLLLLTGGDALVPARLVQESGYDEIDHKRLIAHFFRKNVQIMVPKRPPTIMPSNGIEHTPVIQPDEPADD